MLGFPPAGSTVRVLYIENANQLESFNASAAGGAGRGATHTGGGGHGGHR